MITKSKWDSLKKLMNSLEIREDDMIENFIKGSGKGGQCMFVLFNVFP